MITSFTSVVGTVHDCVPQSQNQVYKEQQILACQLFGLM